MKVIGPPARTATRAIERLDEVNGALNAFVGRLPLPDGDVSGSGALLSGVPVAIKDLIYVEGEPVTAGSPIYGDFTAPFTATCVQRLRSAGAVVIGRTGLHELAYGITSNNPHSGAVRNPYDTERIPGGSSGGSGAAVAAGVVPIALGSDTGGSIRIPASFCGVVGLKPTYGVASRHGVIPLGLSLDHVGPLAATVREAALALEVLAGHDPLDPHSVQRSAEEYSKNLSPDVRKLRVGVPENFYFDVVDHEVEARVRSAVEELQRLGAVAVPVRMPPIEEMNTAARIILLAEAASIYERYAARPELFGDDVRLLILQGMALPATAYLNAQRLRVQYQRDFQAVFEQIDLLATPTTPITAPKIGESTVVVGGREVDVRLASTSLVRAINLVGLPAISVPCGLDSRGLPVGLQLISAAFHEQKILNAALALENLMVVGRFS